MSIYWCKQCRVYSTSENCPSCGKIIPIQEPPYPERFICKKCGRIYEKKRENTCCNVGLVTSSDKDIVLYRNFKIKTEDEPGSRQKWCLYRKEMVLKYIKDSPEFDKDAFDKYFNERMQDAIEYDKKLASPPAPTPKPIVECPYCHSKNTSRISSLSKAVSIAAFGLFSQKRKYQWHCNNCRSDF